MPFPRLALRLLAPVVFGVGFFALWFGVRALLTEEQRILLPAPGRILQAFHDEAPLLLAAVQLSAQGALAGFLAAVAGSFGLALLLSLTSWLRQGLYPYLMILQMTPIVILAPIVILWAPPGLAGVAIITFLICFFPMVVNTTQGLISTDRNLVDFFRMMKASKREEIFMLRVPAALPYFFTGLRIAATLAPIGAVVGDLYAGNTVGGRGGLGYLTIVYTGQLKIPALFATAATCCAFGFVFVSAVLGLHWLCLHAWHDSFSRTDS